MRKRWLAASFVLSMSVMCAACSGNADKVEETKKPVSSFGTEDTSKDDSTTVDESQDTTTEDTTTEDTTTEDITVEDTTVEDTTTEDATTEDTTTEDTTKVEDTAKEDTTKDTAKEDTTKDTVKEDTKKDTTKDTVKEDTKKDTTESKEQTKTEETSAAMPKASEMVKRSLMQAGNNTRIKKAIEKAKKGEEVIIAYIGGSITEGANATPNNKSYAYRSYEYFKETYGNGGDHVKFVNAGMSGTPSTLGMIRYKRDVVDVVGEPDIVIVEFAVNDGDDPTNGDCFESLVLNSLQSEKKPAVVLLFSVFKSKWNLQDRLAPVGKHYDLPMISIKDAVLPEIANGSITEAQFFSDVYHPTNEGHQIMADCINYMFDVANAAPKSSSDITIPANPKIGNSFVGVKMIDSKTKDSNVKITTGGFDTLDNTVGTLQYDRARKTFPNNWMHTKTSSGDSFKMELECKNLVMIYKNSNSKDFGKVDVYVDGQKVQTISGYAAGGWNNPLAKILIKDNKAAKHTIEIKMAEDSTANVFTIFGFGYTK